MTKIQPAELCHLACGAPHGSGHLVVWWAIAALIAAAPGATAINATAIQPTAKYLDLWELPQAKPCHLAQGTKNLVAGGAATAVAPGTTAINAATVKFQAHRPDEKAPCSGSSSWTCPVLWIRPTHWPWVSHRAPEARWVMQHQLRQISQSSPRSCTRIKVSLLKNCYSKREQTEG